MLLTENLKNENGRLTIGGVDAEYLAKKYGTPLYVMDKDFMAKTAREYKNAIEKAYGVGNGRILYASKAFCCLESCRFAAAEGLGLDVVSGGELYTALKAGFPAELICFHGNNKTDAELKMAVLNGVGHVIVDNLFELERLNAFAGEAGKKIKIMFRIKPGIDAHTHDYVRTGSIDSKFGFALENGEAYEIAKETLKMENIEFTGIHCHIGSQIFDIEPFEDAAEVMLNFMAKIKNELGIVLTELNLGGGYGIKYTEENDPVPYGAYIEKISVRVKEVCARLSLSLPFIFMEPGRSLVGPAGLTLYTVGSIKEIKGIKNYLAVDGGMTDNPRYALYKSEYTVLAPTRLNDEKTKEYTIAGKCCESGDLIQEKVLLPEMKSGELLSVLATGAYNYSMAMNYNRIPRAAVVAVSNKEDSLWIKRESYEDIIKNDI